MGLDGFRCDAVPYLFERENTTCESLPETHAFLKEVRRLIDERFPGRVLLAEANLWPTDLRQYFGDGDEMHMAFNFPLMPRIFMALRSEDRTAVVDIMAKMPPIPSGCQWAVFLRNHDELTLSMVDAHERAYLHEHYAQDPRMKLYLGIRRRLAPILEGGRRRTELLNAIILSLPGSPIIYYGDEIGMGDNIWLGDRNGVRTPMQWSADRNAGFSRALSAQLYLPVVQDPPYGYMAINVESQDRASTSLLSWMRRLIAIRKKSKIFGRGTMTILHPENKKILAYVRELEGEVVLCVNNLSRYVQPAELDLKRWAGLQPIEMIGKTPFPPIPEDGKTMFSMGPHGFIWFRLERRG
jgi:maltose alpha-D-glucosyltransferase/alpha-amylase